MPDAAQVDAAMKLVIHFFGSSDWFISEVPHDNGTRGKNTPYSERNLIRVCEHAARISDGAYDYSFSCGSLALGIHIGFDRIKLDRSQFSAILRQGGIRTSAIHLHVAMAQRPPLGPLMLEVAEILSAFYGRVFLPRDAVKRQTGSYHTLGGLPGLHPINFFGKCIVDRLDIATIKAIPDVAVQQNASGLLVEFIGRTNEFSRRELEVLQPAFGEFTFRKFADAMGDTRPESIVPWFLAQLLENRRHRKDEVIFDCDLAPLFM